MGRDVEYNDYIIKFDKDFCKWEFIGTAEKYNETMEKDSYKNDTLVDTIKTLVTENNGTWSGTMASINSKHKELHEFYYATPKSMLKMKNDILNLAPLLMIFDNIKFIPNPNGRNHTFRKIVTVS